MNRTDAVVFGTEAPDDAAVVALLARRARCTGEPLTLLCTGALIAPDVVLTAAHCLEIFGTDGAYEVFLGARLLPEPEPQGRFVRVARAVRHPGYDRTTHANDAALLRLSRPVDVSPLPLAEPGKVSLEAGLPARVVGFGETRDASAPPGQRRQGELQLTEVEAGAFRAGASPAMSCVGDSGGPVLVRGVEGQEMLAGITASGDVACREEAFNVRVDALLEDFIHPFLAEPLEPQGPHLALESLCTASCTSDAQCPAGLACESVAGGEAARCLQPALQEGNYGAVCSEDAQCGTGGVCARLEPEGEDACRCFTPCGQPPPPPPEEASGCTGAPGAGLWAWLACAWVLVGPLVARRPGRRS
ncbi:S1 family peptidase [Archangium lansingense]|uniref:Trypsin-like serine protease n=1 Tax=Archangium lansingense TaxID=2995310 RepID=A0ABT4ALZ8_9BACT|nr:trypsin-like serine protease [Archangium lansinium]MCY1082723.1 trypsin-like serine protease [Archangium lansinium]